MHFTPSRRALVVCLAALALLSSPTEGSRDVSFVQMDATTTQPAVMNSVAGFTVGWVYDAPTGDWVITFGSLSDSNRYNSIGFADSGMDGIGISCSNKPARCVLLKLLNYDVRYISDLTIISATDTNVTTSVPLATMTTKSGYQRGVFAQGPYSPITTVMDEHDKKKVALMDPMEPSLIFTKVDLVAAAWVIAAGVLVGWIVVGAIMQWFFKPMMSDRVQRFVLTAGLLTVVALPVVVAMLIGRSEEVQRSSQPYFRGIGVGAAFLMLLSILPVLRHASIAKLAFRSSFERVVIPFHALIGVMLFIFTSVHGIGMLVAFPEKAGEIDGENPPLFGILAWGLMALMIVTAFLRVKFYATFRVIHWVYVLVFVFAIIHYRNVLFMLIPPAALLLIDYGLRVGTALWLEARVIGAEHDNTSGITWLRVSSTTKTICGKKFNRPTVDAGQFYCLVIPALGSAFSHPFTVASSRGGEMIFAISATGRWTRALAENASTVSLQNARVLLMGPYGAVSFPMEHITELVIVVGGSGVTTALSTLESLVVCVDDERSGELQPNFTRRYPLLQRVQVLFIAKHQTFMGDVASMMESLVLRCAKVGLTNVNATFCCTATPGEQAASGRQAPSAFVQMAVRAAESEECLKLPSILEHVSSAANNNQHELTEVCPLPHASHPASVANGTSGSSRNSPSIAPESTPAHVTPSPISWREGRPDVSAFLESFILGKPEDTAGPLSHTSPRGSPQAANKSIGVFSCGPSSLIEQVKKAVDRSQESLRNTNLSIDCTNQLVSHYEVFTI